MTASTLQHTFFVGICGVLLLTAGCTRNEVYNSAQGWREQECQKIEDMEARNRCMQTADLPYQEYERKRQDY